MKHFHFNTSLLGSLALAASLLAWSPNGLAIYIRDDVAASNYDALATQPEYASAGWIQVNDNTAKCTGTLVAANKVLTAAHCVYDDLGNLNASQQFAFGLSADVPLSFTNNVTAVVVSSLYDYSDPNASTYDLALLTLNNPLTQTPAVLWSNIIASSPTPFTGVMLGYGFQGTGLVQSNVGATARLAAMNLIDSGGIIDLQSDFDKPDGSTNTFGNPYPIALEGTTCNGDSGGPLFIEGGGVVGVLSWGYNPYRNNDCHYGDVSGWAPIANPLNLEFLASQGINVSYIPEPPTLPMFLSVIIAWSACGSYFRAKVRFIEVSIKLFQKLVA